MPRISTPTPVTPTTVDQMRLLRALLSRTPPENGTPMNVAVSDTPVHSIVYEPRLSPSAENRLPVPSRFCIAWDWPAESVREHAVAVSGGTTCR